jgi:hypothetical protein
VAASLQHQVFEFNINHLKPPLCVNVIKGVYGDFVMGTRACAGFGKLVDGLIQLIPVPAQPPLAYRLGLRYDPLLHEAVKRESYRCRNSAPLQRARANAA